MIETLIHWIEIHGYGIIYAVLALGIFGLPIPDEWLLAYLGNLIFKGKLLPLPTYAAAFFGSIFGMTVNYLLGRSLGLYFIQRFGSFVHITGDRIAKAHIWFERAGRWGLMIGYFLPGIRHLTAVAAGTAKMPFAEFSLFAWAGGLIWSGIYITLGYMLEESWARGTARIHYVMIAVSASIVAIFALYLIMKRLRKKG